MSRGINKVILIGNLGQDPVIRHTSNGNSVVNITLATSDNWRDKKTGELKEKVEWHKIVLFGKIADIAFKYLRKGSQIYIEGSLQTKKWKNSDGVDCYTTEIIVNMNGTMQMLSSRFINDKNNFDKKNLNLNDNAKINIKKNFDINSKNDSLVNFDNEILF